MLILKAIAHSTIWGGHKFSQTKGEKVGHLYSLISNGEFESEILNTEFKGHKFSEYFELKKAEFGLGKFKKFPFLIALVEAKENLSLQVHPNDKMAKILENSSFGKNESFVFLNSPKGLFGGLKVRNLDDLKVKIIKNKWDEIVQNLAIKKGDYVFIEAGTLHALQAGSLVYEIEENCNITYRFYDFDRVDEKGQKRPLHTQKALKALILNKSPKIQRFKDEIKERFYSIQFFKGVNFYQNHSKTLEILTILKGKTRLENHKIQTGTSLVLEPNESVNLNKSDFIIARCVL